MKSPKQFDGERRRKFLLEMATGTGKTLLCAALIRRFLMTRNAERVLFIVDRIELAKQTMEDFAVVLPEYKPVIFKSARGTGELLGSSSSSRRFSRSWSTGGIAKSSRPSISISSSTTKRTARSMAIRAKSCSSSRRRASD